MAYAKRWPTVGKRTNGNVTFFKSPILFGIMSGAAGKSKDGLYERIGYKLVIFDDHRGRLEGEVYQKTALKLLGFHGAKLLVGAGLQWSKNNAKVTVDLIKPIFGKNTTVTINGAGRFDLKKNREVFIKKLDAKLILRKKKPRKKSNKIHRFG